MLTRSASIIRLAAGCYDIAHRKVYTSTIRPLTPNDPALRLQVIQKRSFVRIMKKVVLLLALFSISLVPAKAQLLGVEVGGYGSWLKPADLEQGYGGGAVVRGQVLGFLGVDFRVGYYSFSDPSVDMVPIEGSFMFRLPLPVISFFAGLGGGYYQFSGEDGFSLGAQEGYFANVGVEATLGDWRTFFEWRYQVLEPEVDTAGGGYSKGEEIDFSGYGFSLGVTYMF